MRPGTGATCARRSRPRAPSLSRHSAAVGWSRRAGRVSLRLQTLKSIFEALIALSDTLESTPGCRGPAARPVQMIADWLAEIGPEIEADRALDSAEKQASLQGLHEALKTLPAESKARLSCRPWRNISPC